MCVKGLVYRLSHDCHFDIDRDASHCRFSSDDTVDLLGRTICTNVVVSETGQQTDLTTKRERLLTIARENPTTGLTNGRAANWVPEVEFRPFRALTRRQMTFPFCC